MRPFIRRDSKVSIRRQFGVAGAAFIDISRGTGPELDWSYAVIAATTDRAATDTLGQMIDELRAKIMPLLDEVQKAVVAFTAVAQRAIDPAGPLERPLSSAAGIAHRVESGRQAAAPRPSRCAHEEGAVRMRPVVLSPLAALALAACGGGGPVDTGPPPDVKLDQANRAGTQALSVDMPSLAVREYKVALARAYERDDAGAIADVAYNLALAQMKSGDSKAALATLRDARAELDRRRVQIPAELFLVEAAAAYRIGDYVRASADAQQALDRQAKDPDTVPRAWFIRGLVAAERSDGAALNQAIAALPPTKQPDLEPHPQALHARPP